MRDNSEIMANGDQLKALLRSHAEGDDRHFYSGAMQMAAHEAKHGHGKLAEELRELIDAAKARRNASGGQYRSSVVYCAFLGVAVRYLYRQKIKILLFCNAKSFYEFVFVGEKISRHWFGLMQ